MTIILDIEDEYVEPDYAGEFRFYDPRKHTELEVLTQQFLAAGGEIKVIPPDVKHKPRPTKHLFAGSQYPAGMAEQTTAKEALQAARDKRNIGMVLQAMDAGIRGYTNLEARTGLSVRQLERLAKKFNVRMTATTHKETDCDSA